MPQRSYGRGIVDELDGVEVIRAAAAGRRQRDGRRHGAALQQDTESAQRPQLEGRQEHDGQGAYYVVFK